MTLLNFRKNRRKSFTIDVWNLNVGTLVDILRIPQDLRKRQWTDDGNIRVICPKPVVTTSQMITSRGPENCVTQTLTGTSLKCRTKVLTWELLTGLTKSPSENLLSSRIFKTSSN